MHLNPTAALMAWMILEEKTKEERRRVAQLQELENTIAELESKLANLTSQLESPFVKPAEAAKLMPQSAYPHYFLAQIHERANHLEMAIKEYKEAYRERRKAARRR